MPSFMNYRKLLFAFVFFSIHSISCYGQTSFQNFGTGTASQTSQTGSTAVIPAPTSGTTWARGGLTAPNAPVNILNTSNPLGTTGSYAQGVASTSGSVTKFSPWVGYTGGTEFYTSFKVLFGDSSAGSTATSGVWKFYQGAGAMYSDVNDFTGAQVFTGLTFTYGAGGALALTYRGGASNLTTGLTQTSFASGTVYTIEIVGNNKTSGTINYAYSGAAQTVAVQKFDLYVNGTLIGNDLAEAALPANTSITSGTFIGISSTSNVANVFVDDVTTYNAVPATIGTITSAQTGNWSSTSTWVGGVVPTSGVNAIIASTHVVTMDTTTGGINVRNSGTTTTVNSGGTLATAVTYTNDGATTINGSFQLNSGGWSSGANNLVYGAAGTLIFNNTYTANSGTYWPTTSGPYNVSVNSGCPLSMGFSRTVAGLFQTADAISLGGNTLTLTGTCQINVGGFFFNSPIYGNTSLLKYNINGYYGRGFEWTTTGTIGTTPGYPNDVQITNNTTLDYPNTGAGAFSANLGLNRDLIIDLGSSLYMDYGGSGNKSGSLTIARNFTLSGNLSLGNANGGDVFVGGNWTRTGTLTPNLRTVNFTGSSAQTLTGTTTFDYLTMNGAGGLTLNNNITVNQNLVFTSGKITLGTSDLTLVGTVSGNSASTYVVTNSSGQFKKIVGGSAILFPVGNSAYNPITFTNSGTSDTYGVRVVDGAITTGVSNTKTVQRSWITTEAVAGNSNLAVVAQYNAGEPDTGFAAATTPYIGFYNGSTWTQVGANLAGANPYTATSTANTLPSDLTTGTQYFVIGKENAFVSTATKLVITAISPTSPTAGVGFSVTVRSQDAYSDFSSVVANTAFTLTTNGAAGAISGTVTGTILAGTSTITITGVILPTASAVNTVTLTATRTSGDALTAGTSSLFTVLPPASQLAFVGVPTTGNVGVNIASFTVEARRPDNSVDTAYTGNITIAIATGSGVLSGTLTVAAVAGVATFSTAQFDTATIYTIITSSGSLSTNTSGNITITNNTDYYRSKASGNWNVAATWESSVDGSTGWATATLIPNAYNTVYIQTGHTVTLTQNQACNDLNIASGPTSSTVATPGKIDLASFTLSVYGKMRDYYGAVGTVPGTNQNNGYSVYPFLATTGKVSIVGTTRTVLTNGEWGATITAMGTGVFPLEINMTNNSQVATFTANVKSTYFNLVTGTVSGSIISAATGTAGFGDITIGSGATLISSADSTLSQNVFQRTGTTLAGTLAITGTLKLTGAFPRFSMTAVVNTTGTVEYGGADQTFISVANSGAAMTYNNVTISGTGTKSLLSTPTTMTGDLNVNASSFVIKTSEVIEVKKAVNVAASGATFEIKDSGQLIQVDDIVNPSNVYIGSNTGNIIYNRTATAIKGYDYVYWSSPVTGQDIATLYTITTPGYKYFWNPTVSNINTASTGTSGNWQSASGVMTPAKGYIVRGSSSYGMTATNIPAVFTGIPNNGQISTSISRGGNTTSSQTGANLATVTNLDDNWNLISNPYASSIDALSFLSDNNNALTIGGFVWLWRHNSTPTLSTNVFYGSSTSNYNTNDYIAYNSMGSNPAGFNGKIAAGQGFFVNMVDGPGAPNPAATQTVTFKNTMRSKTYSNTQFYRNSSHIETNLTVEKHRIWLDLVDINSNSVSTLIGYTPEATVGLDRKYDAFKNVANDKNIYSLADNTTLIIQGRPTPFDDTDQVPIGVRIMLAGNYKIAIAAVDGLFADGQPIYLEDKELNIIYDLRQSPYSFSAVAGTFNDRFVLRYTNTALSNPDFESLSNSVVVATNHGEMTIRSYVENIQEVTVYDILGRQLFDAKNISNTNFITSNISMSQQTLIVKIKLANGFVVTRKIIL